MSRPRIWYYRGAWRCAAMGNDAIGVGKSAEAAYLDWFHKMTR